MYAPVSELILLLLRQGRTERSRKMLRRPCVAGRFYPGAAETLKRDVLSYLVSVEKKKAVAIIAPHAGYIYSGGVAGAVYSSVEIPDDVVLIGPNHTGLGAICSVMTEGVWETPLGTVNINAELAKGILGSSRLFSADTRAHTAEHSLEVQLPFIQILNSKASIVPITVMRADAAGCAEMGNAIAKAIRDYGKPVLIAVSSDMNHYEEDEMTRRKDRLAIKAILNLDAERLLKTVSANNITMCGVLPAAIAITAAKGLGAKSARMAQYATSGEVSGDYAHVVGYCGIVID